MNRVSQIITRSFLIVMLFTLAGCVSLSYDRPPIAIPAQAPPPVVPSKQPQVALVLGGGGARGFAHIGVIQVLQQEKIPINLIVGTSSGSIIGVMYADNPNGRALENTLLNTQRSDLLDISALHPFEGPITGYALQTYLETHLRAKQFSQLKIPFVAVATDLDNGVTVPISSGPIPPAINASSALPPFFRPVHLYGQTLVDGGATDPIAVDVAARYHPKVIIAVSIVDDLPRDMPTNAVGIYDRAYAISDLRFANYCSSGASVVIHPYVGQIGTFDDSHKRSLIQAGRRAALRALPQICAVLAQNHIHSNCS